MLFYSLQPDGTHLFNFVTATSWESYLTDMSKTGTWGTHLEVQMIASMINVTICIVTDSSNADDSMVWLYPNDRHLMLLILQYSLLAVKWLIIIIAYLLMMHGHDEETLFEKHGC